MRTLFRIIRRFKYFFATVTILLMALLIWSNISIEVTSYVVSSDRLPDSFDGFRIVHISDLHDTEFGKSNKRLLEKIREADPDILAITGDSFDSCHSDISSTLSFYEEAMKIAQCYFVVGNNEGKFKRSEYKQYEEMLTGYGVIILHNQGVEIERDGVKITVFGVDDPGYNDNFYKNLNKCKMDDNYTVLLSHRPEYYNTYVSRGFDLVLSGHAHGGQVRLPLIGGIFAPQQGLFPKYTSGSHTTDTTTMVVSRGLGHSSIPLRINNRPELVIIELHTLK